MPARAGLWAPLRSDPRFCASGSAGVSLTDCKADAVKAAGRTIGVRACRVGSCARPARSPTRLGSAARGHGNGRRLVRGAVEARSEAGSLPQLFQHNFLQGHQRRCLEATGPVRRAVPFRLAEVLPPLSSMLRAPPARLPPPWALGGGARLRVYRLPCEPVFEFARPAMVSVMCR